MHADPERWGIARGYHDIAGRWHETPRATAEAFLSVMGADGGSPPGLGDENPVWVVRRGERVRAEGPFELRTEDGAVLRGEGDLPPDLPLGYHDIHRPALGRTVRLIVSPGRCHLPEDLREWGLAVQLYATRSRESWGMGDLADLRRLGRWARGKGAGLVLLNPLHAPLPGVPVEPSPYYPGSRVFRNPLYLRIAEVPGARDLGADLAALDARGRALGAERRIDRDAVCALKSSALEALWALCREGIGPEMEGYEEAEGEALRDYATFCALSEVHGRPWTRWPAELRHPRGPAVARFAAERADRVRFHRWVQWLMDRQLAAAGREVPLVQDLAIGADSAGADAWIWQDAYASGVRVGAPPDEFNTQGQDWGLPPFDPWRLRLQLFEPFVRTVRAGLRHAGGLRFDHVMGLFRLFWIPPGGSARDGAYVRYPARELLDILALESERAGAWVVGEDLGTVEDGVREELQARGVLSYRLMWFEPQPPRTWPRQVLAAVTTHDLPTVAGLWNGSDLRAQEELGLHPNAEGTRQLRARLRDWTGVPDDAPEGEVVEAAHHLLASAPSMLVTATLDDALHVEERPNVPGTTTEWPNWSIALPIPLEEIETDPRVEGVMGALRAGRG
ncbi:4-alpha-glucanotransferase [Myxococcota bacterium]|nr:4-alpha-glucanotransferase [Myxococcota bacterium]